MKSSTPVLDAQSWPRPVPGVVGMLNRQRIIAAAGVAVAAMVGCGPAAADSDYHEHTETARYTIDITYPLDYPDEKAVSDFVNADRGYFLDWVARFGAKGPSRQYMYAVDAKTYQAKEPATTSLVLTMNNDTGAAHQAHPQTLYHAFNFDRLKQVPITFDTLFTPDADVVSVLRPMVQKLYNRPTFTVTPSDFQNFALTDDAVIFFFGEGQLLSADNSGPRQISVPRRELAPLMA